jgi:hypothetical protein
MSWRGRPQKAFQGSATGSIAGKPSDRNQERLRGANMAGIDAVDGTPPAAESDLICSGWMEEKQDVRSSNHRIGYREVGLSAARR